MKIISVDNKGFMLVEVMVALVILTILVVSFTQVFSSGVTTIFSMGHRTRAVAEAQAVLDGIYQDEIVDHEDSDSNLFNFPIAAHSPVAEDALSEQLYDPVYYIHYSVQDQTVETVADELYYNRVTVLVFYQNGSRFVTLTALVPGGVE